MPILGAHMSIAGGYYKAVEYARACGCQCVQLFTKNNNQWRAKELTDDDVRLFREALKCTGIGYPLSHDSYLINLASPDAELWQKSIEAFRVELLRAERLGIPYVVTHPGAFTSSTEAAGLRRVSQALDIVHSQTRGIRALTLLENTAGQGSCLGWKFEHLATIRDALVEPERVAVCIDTCHAWAAGYPLQTTQQYADTMGELDRVLGIGQVRAIHLNDSKQPLGSRVDRHDHIGRGHLGIEPFRQLLNDPRFAATPMYLETAKEQENGEAMDVVNLRVLRSLVGGQSAALASEPAARSTASERLAPGARGSRCGAAPRKPRSLRADR
jgi:deoxyribonuclease-4